MTACPGPCSSRPWRMALDYNDTLDAWREALTRWENARQQVLDAQAATGADEETRRMLRRLDEIRPQRPLPPEVSFAPGDPVWCSRDRAAIRKALAELDDLAALLESWSDGHRGASSGERTSSRRTTAASPSPIADTLDELYQSLAKVEADWRDAHPELPPRPHRAGPEARPRTIAWLLGQLDQILAHPGSVPFGRGVLAWQSRLQHLAKSDPVVRRRPVPCPRCDYRALRTRDDGYTQCGHCGRLLSEDEYGELAEAAEVRPYLAQETP